ncbi:hypothetical protein ACTHQ8_22730 [Lysinibacillus odysseyi]|uniref:hypothetical protein n=1 Tax=Lysinibacillus odysseyi TaxID=202611 RepID=UPI0007AB384C|nr:hypothetical protein [Lysinibacillus odysseyi]
MAAKHFREQIRVDMLTSQLIYALLEKLSTSEKKMSKSELHRTAIYRMAKEELTAEEFQEILLGATDLDRM